MWVTSQEVVHTGLNILMPVKQIRICSADAPYMSSRVNALTLKRQKAFNAHGVDSVQLKHCRNLVNRERKACRGRYYESKIQHLKGEKPKRWCDEVKRLSGAESKNGDLISQITVEYFSDLSQL